jgi:FMN phosphatase YigB (HAD superfamily)
MADPRSRPYDIITFDCYGTLIDWETGIADAFRDATAADGSGSKPPLIRAMIRRFESRRGRSG